MSQQSAASKPSLQGVRIKARKGAVKAQAKHEPTSIYLLILFYFISSQCLLSLQRSTLQTPRNCTRGWFWFFRNKARPSWFYSWVPQICRCPIRDHPCRRSFATRWQLHWRWSADVSVHCIQCERTHGGGWHKEIHRGSQQAYQEVLPFIFCLLSVSPDFLISPLDINIFKSLLRNLHSQLCSSTYIAGRPHRRTSYRLQSDSWSPKV